MNVLRVSRALFIRGSLSSGLAGLRVDQAMGTWREEQLSDEGQRTFGG